MLVPSMTLAEIKKEIDKDFPIVRNKGIYVQRKLLHDLKPHGSDKIVRYLDYVSKYKNNWIIRFGLSKKDSKMSQMVWYHNEKGLAAISIADNGAWLCYHTPHFFRRVNERLNLNLSRPQDIIRRFMDENDRFHVEILEEFGEGLFTIFCATRSGYILGVEDDNNHFFKMNTFITHDMLKGSQRSLAEELNSEMGKYKYIPGS